MDGARSGGGPPGNAARAPKRRIIRELDTDMDIDR